VSCESLSEALFFVRLEMVKVIKIILPIVLVLGIVFLLVKLLPRKKAAIKVDASPGATVFINGKEVGKTPYENEKAKPGDIDLRLVPESGLTPWERRLTLTSGTKVIVHKEFAAQPDEEASQILYLEKTGAKGKAGLVLTSVPDGVSVSIDGQMRGFAPLNLEDVGGGEHKIVLNLPGYEGEEIIARTLTGHRLVVEVKLAKAKEETGEESKKTEEEKEIVETQVLIKDTPTGWLRVRMEPSTAATEAAKVKPGEKYPYLDEDKGWYKIEYEEGKEGWVSGRYAEKIENKSSEVTAE